MMTRSGNGIKSAQSGAPSRIGMHNAHYIIMYLLMNNVYVTVNTPLPANALFEVANMVFSGAKATD